MKTSTSTFRIVGASAAALLLSLSLQSASFADGDNEEATHSDLPELGQAGTSKSDWGDSTVTVNQLTKSENSGYTSLTWTVANDGGSSFSIRDFRNETFIYNPEAVSTITGVALVDNENDIRYYSSKDSENECLCTGPRQPVNLTTQIGDGGSVTLWNAFDLREETTTVDVEIPGFKPITDLSVN